MASIQQITRGPWPLLISSEEPVAVFLCSVESFNGKNPSCLMVQKSGFHSPVDMVNIPLFTRF